MEQFKRSTVIMLSTKQKFNNGQYIISKYPNNLLNGKLLSGIKKCEGNIKETNQHLYIISDDEIKDNDWCIGINQNSKVNAPFQCRDNKSFINSNFLNSTDCIDIKKIIATTNTLLIINCNSNGFCIGSDGGFCPLCKTVPQLSKQFIEKYIESYNKNEVITDVLVEYEIEHFIDKETGEVIRYTTFNSKLKINPKDNTITIKKVKDNYTNEEMYSNMQLYMEYCKWYAYITPEEWIKNNK